MLKTLEVPFFPFFPPFFPFAILEALENRNQKSVPNEIIIYVLRLVSLKQLKTFENGNLIYVTEKGLPAPLGTSRRHFQTLFKLLSVNCELKLCQFFIWTFQEFSLVVKYSYDHRKFSVGMIVPRRDRNFSHVTCVMKPKSGQS